MSRLVSATVLAVGVLTASVAAPAPARADEHIALSVYEVEADRADEPVVWRVEVFHQGADGPADVVVDLVAPEGLPLEHRGLGAGDRSAPMACQELRCAVTLLPGEQAAALVSVQPTAGGSYTLTARSGAATAESVVEVRPALRPGTLVLQPLPRPLLWGSDVRLRGTLRGSDGGVPVGAVALWRRTSADAAWEQTRYGYGLLGADGGFALEVDTRAQGELQVRWDGDDETTGATVSEVVALLPVLRPALTADPVRVPPGGSSRLTVRVEGPPGTRSVAVERYAGGAWQPLATRTVTVPGAVSVDVRGLATGTHRYRAVLSGDAVPSSDRVLPVTMAGRGSASAFAFLGRVAGGRPARWNPCTPIRFAVNATLAPPGGVADLTEALRRVSQASGLVFQSVGRTTYTPRRVNDPRSPAPLVLAWVRPEELGGAAGWGGASWDGSTGRISRGMVLVENGLPAGFGAGGTHGGVLMHEIAHAIGLDHVGAAHQIMRPSTDQASDATMWGAGDLSGLRRVGRPAGCLA